MTYQCERCGQTVLETDIVCWHCGWRLPRPEPKKPASAKAIAAEEEPLSLSAVVIYAALTLVTVVAIVLVTWSLEQKPFFVTNPESSLEPGWVPITDQEQQFTLNIPSRWQWFEKQNEGQQSGFEALAKNDQLRAAVAPLANIAADTEVLLVALHDTTAEGLAPPGFVVVARSVDSRQVSSEQTLNQIRQNDGNLLNAEITEGFTGQNQVDILLDIDGVDSPFRCRERLAQGPQAGYLVAACTPRAGYPRYRSEFEAMVISFQPLTR